MGLNPAKAALGVAAGVVAAGGALYGLQRAFVHHALAAPDPDADRDLVLAHDRYERVPSHDGGSIAIYERGAGPTIVFIHGVTLSSRTWTYQFETLSEAGFRVVAVDLRGHGYSDVGEAGHSVAVLGRDLATVLDAIDARDCILVGHSLGGIAVQSFAIQFPELLKARVAGIVLLSTFGKVPALGIEHGVEGMLSPGLVAMTVFPNFGYTVARAGFGRHAHPRHVDLTRRMIASTPPGVARASVHTVAGMNLIPDLASIDVPTLVVGGTADVVAPINESRRLARTIPGAELVEMRGAGHMIMFERTAEFDDLLIEFADRLGVGVNVSKVT